MNILILHKMGRPKFWRQAIADLELALPIYAPNHNYIVHNAELPLPGFVRDLDFHGIILGPTFLCFRYNPEAFQRIRKEYEFIRHMGAYKIALPQDDYHCSAVLDRWVTDWGVDKVYTVCPEHWDILYPNYLAKGGNLTQGYTGFISNALIKRAASPRLPQDRPIDVCYRARKLQYSFGRLGVQKSEIGVRFKDACKNQSLVTDISIESKDTIHGEAWHDFLENSKWTLGANSGSSLLDPEGNLRRSVEAYVANKPHATFEEVETVFFPGQDNKYVFTAISPRVLEAGLLKTGQVLTLGPYSGILKPWVHYVPLSLDYSNTDEVFSAIKDIDYIEKITCACKEKLLSVPQLRMETHVSNLINDIEMSLPEYHGHSERNFRKAAIRYEKQLKVMGTLIWAKQDIKILLAKHLPMTRLLYRKIKHGEQIRS